MKVELVRMGSREGSVSFGRYQARIGPDHPLSLRFVAQELWIGNACRDCSGLANSWIVR